MSSVTIIKDRLSLLETLTLGHGSHEDFNEGVCALEAVAWLAGAKHSDAPDCVCPVISAIVREWNDSLPDDEHRNRLIRPLLVKLVGTRVEGTPQQRDSALLRRMFMVQDWYIRARTPAFLRLAKLDKEASDIEACDPVVDLETLKKCEPPTIAARNTARRAAESAAESAARNTARRAAESAARSAARRAARSAAESAAERAAYSAADSATESAAESAAYSAADSAARSAARSAAESAAESTVKSALAATVNELHQSFADLIVRMCEATS